MQHGCKVLDVASVESQLKTADRVWYDLEGGHSLVIQDVSKLSVLFPSVLKSICMSLSAVPCAVSSSGTCTFIELSFELLSHGMSFVLI